MKKKNISLTIVLIIFLIIFIILSGLVYENIKTYNASEEFLNSILKIQSNQEETIFSIDQITYFSSSDANIETNSNSSFTISGLYQYTDVAIFLNTTSNELTAKNTLKSVILSDFNYSLKPDIGTQNIYYKNINDFATSKLSSENIITDSIKFDTTSEDVIDYSKPVLYNNCANPITLCYVNSNLQDKFTLEKNVSNIAHNGSLLKSCGITLNSLSSNLSFKITIVNNLDETYICPITLNFPVLTESSTVYDGGLTLKDNLNYKFIRT